MNSTSRAVRCPLSTAIERWLVVAVVASGAWSCAKPPTVPPGVDDYRIGPASSERDEAKRVPSDTAITAAVARQLEREPGIDERLISVVTADGIVQLTGTVHDLTTKDRAARGAETVLGVRAVVDRLNLDVPHRDDREVAADVLSVLRDDAATDQLDITAASTNGIVVLKGNVQSWQQKELAARLTKEVRGVVNVDNELNVNYGVHRTDRQMREDVESRLRWDSRVDPTHIYVGVSDGRVRLTGRVGSAAERSRALEDAWVSGVVSVDGNGLFVDPAMEHREIRSARLVMKSDHEIAQAIVDAAFYDPRVESTEIKPDVTGGIVTLRGIVDTVQAKLAAEALARNTVGVVKVRDLVEVRSNEPETDAERSGRIESALAISPVTGASKVEVSVVAGRATLSGTATDEYARARAAQIAGSVAGIREVDNQLTVERPPKGYGHGACRGPYEPFAADYAPETASRADTEIARDIELELRSNPYVDNGQVKVKVTAGAATLSGTVDSWQARRAATEDAFQGGALAV